MKYFVFLAALTFCFTISSCGGKEEKATGAKTNKVVLQEVSVDNSKQELVYSGNIEAANVAQVGFAVPGVVNNVLVQEGQRVAKGQLLASIDATEFSNALIIANAGLEQAEDMYKRLDDLYQKKSLPEKDYIEIKTKVAQAKANKNINAKHIADSRLYAPMSGIISVRHIEQGSTAAPGIPAFTIVKTDQLYAKIAVPESEIGIIRNGMAASVSIPTINEKLTGTIAIINPQADAVSRSYTVKIKIPNTSGRLLPGMIADVTIVSGAVHEVLAIPATAIVRDADGITYVFVSDDGRKAVRKRVSVGKVTRDNKVIILDGLSQGNKMVISGNTRLKDGDAISQ